ncbi:MULTISPECIES: reverse gyrase [Metallosphaera]|uniref:reverse gyrase n=1 Tax=Metallosphaera TaxID=41980 RepID=UPI001F06EC98|nr:reverse gyrase [Metallosphaera sedula]MCH1770507.1 reverse gyrase [Metallosphaera sedula]MCP6728705.1 reverse gyrase [Metallosphaera sedula]
MNADERLPDVVYMGSCPNCGSDITSVRLGKGSVCERCLGEEIDIGSLQQLVEILQNAGTIKSLLREKNILEEERKVIDLFKRVIGSEPLGPQRSWIIRALRGESFPIIAPPGLGKTTFGIVMSLYYASRSEKSLMIFPTRTLVSQVVQKIQEMGKSLDFTPRLVYYVSGLTQSKKDELSKSLAEEDFDIFISTSRYVIQHLDEINKINYKYLFVDDVDAVLKSGKSSLTILKLMGFSDENVTKVRELLKTSRDNTSSFDEIRKIRERFAKDRVAIFSSATITRSNPVFTSLMGFKPGGATIYLRNVIDSYIIGTDIVSQTVELVKRLGPGGLVFVPVDKGLNFAREISQKIDFLKASVVSSNTTKKLEEFEQGSIDVLIGVATHYGLLVRGIDIPWRVRYAVFAGIPKFRFKLGETMHPLAMLRILTLLSVVLKDPEITRILRFVKYRLRRTSTAALAMLAKAVKDGALEDRTMIRAYEIVNTYLKDKRIVEAISKFGDISFSGDYISIPDYLTYIQASGRTSRLYGGHLTTGLSVLLVDDMILFDLLKKKLSFILDDMKWNPLDLDSQKIGDRDLQEIVKQIDKERAEIIRRRKIEPISMPMEKIKTVLLIVESPNKAKTISNFFSRPSIRDFDGLRVYETVIGDKILMVTSSGGHVYDLTTKDLGVYGVEVKSNGDVNVIPFYNTLKRCENGHQFTEYAEGGKCPICMSTNVRDKRSAINVLRRLVLEADEVLIGTDPDVEGEKIAWDLYLNLKPFNSNIFRAEFHEVTRRAITEALNSPRTFSINMLRSQLVRRIEDRWIGFKLSNKLKEEFWKEYCTKTLGNKDCDTENRNLSAGRVQTPVLGWVISRYEEYLRTKRTMYVAKAGNLNILIPKQPGIRKNSKIKIIIQSAERKQDTVGPFPAYTTDTYLSDASGFFFISAQEAMRIAQDLFENGLITYHRTDSTRISNVGISIAESYLKDLLGERYREIFVPRSWGEGGAHEAIRPTRPLNGEQLRAMVEQGEIEPSKRLTYNHYRLYDMIFRRFLSSQLVPLVVEKEILQISAKKGDETLKLESDTLEIVTNVRLSKDVPIPSEILYIPFRSIGETLLTQIKDKLPEEIDAVITSSFQKSDHALYTQGELVSLMKQRKIGRPSTYAFIISTLLKRGYVFETMKVKRLIPSKLGQHVYEFLNSRYSNFVSEDRTRSLLERMDLIEEGKEDYRQVLKQLYNEIQDIR